MFSTSCLLSSCLPFFMSDFPASILPCLQVRDHLPACFIFDCLPASSEVPLPVSCRHMYANISRISMCCLPSCLLCLPDCLSVCWLWAWPVLLVCYDPSCTCLNYNAFLPIRLVALPCPLLTVCLRWPFAMLFLACLLPLWNALICFDYRCPFAMYRSLLSCLLVFLTVL